MYTCCHFFIWGMCLSQRFWNEDKKQNKNLFFCKSGKCWKDFSFFQENTLWSDLLNVVVQRNPKGLILDLVLQKINEKTINPGWDRWGDQCKQAVDLYDKAAFPLTVHFIQSHPPSLCTSLFPSWVVYVDERGMNHRRSREEISFHVKTPQFLWRY